LKFCSSFFAYWHIDHKLKLENVAKIRENQRKTVGGGVIWKKFDAIQTDSNHIYYKLCWLQVIAFAAELKMVRLIEYATNSLHIGLSERHTEK